MSAESKEKTIQTLVESAFIKGNTIEILLAIEGWEQKNIPLNKNDRITIKLEIDTNPPNPPGETEMLFATLPIPYSYKILELPSLFAGKLHAILCREYKSGRVKGRDYYDFIWYINKGVFPDLMYLRAKLIQSGHWNENDSFDSTALINLLESKFNKVDWKNTKKDVLPFIKDSFEVEIWSKDFFKSLLKRIKR